MMVVTRLVVLHVLSKRPYVSTDYIEDIIIRQIPVLVGVFPNSSPYEVEEEIDIAINQINMYAKEMLGIELCIEKVDKMIRVHDVCTDIIKKLHEDTKHYIETSNSLFAYYGKLLISVLE